MCTQQYVNSQPCTYSVSSAHRRMRLRVAVRRARWRQKRLSSRAARLRRGEQASHRIASHRIASVPSAHTAPHWGPYPYSGAARITRNTVRKIHSRCFSVTALQVKLLSINLCFTTETYSQCMYSTVTFLGRTSTAIYNTAGDMSLRQTGSYIEGLRATCCR